MKGWLEVLPQALLLSVIVWHWVNRPQKWLDWTLGVVFGVTMLLPVLGMLVKK